MRRSNQSRRQGVHSQDYQRGQQQRGQGQKNYPSTSRDRMRSHAGRYASEQYNDGAQHWMQPAYTQGAERTQQSGQNRGRMQNYTDPQAYGNSYRESLYGPSDHYGQNHDSMHNYESQNQGMQNYGQDDDYQMGRFSHPDQNYEQGQTSYFGNGLGREYGQYSQGHSANWEVPYGSPSHSRHFEEESFGQSNMGQRSMSQGSMGQRYRSEGGMGMGQGSMGQRYQGDRSAYRGGQQGWRADADMPLTMYQSDYSQNQSDSGSTFRGRGPKGYQRSDERLTELVSETFYEDPSIDSSEIEVKVKDGEVTLEGSVESRDMKRMAEDLVESITGVKEVINHLRVQKNRGQTETSSEKGSEREGEREGEKSSGWQTKANATNTGEQFSQKKRVGER